MIPTPYHPTSPIPPFQGGTRTPNPHLPLLAQAQSASQVHNVVQTTVTPTFNVSPTITPTISPNLSMQGGPVRPAQRSAVQRMSLAERVAAQRVLDVAIGSRECACLRRPLAWGHLSSTGASQAAPNALLQAAPNHWGMPMNESS